MAKTLHELVKDRMAKMAAYLPSTIEEDPIMGMIKGPLFNGSSTTHNMFKYLIPRIKHSDHALTETIVDSWLEERAKKDYIKAKK